MVNHAQEYRLIEKARREYKGKIISFRGFGGLHETELDILTIYLKNHELFGSICMLDKPVGRIRTILIAMGVVKGDTSDQAKSCC